MPTIFLHLGKFQPAKVGIFQPAETGEYSTGVDNIASWLKVLKSYKRAIFTAAAKAQEAVDWMTRKVRPELAAASSPSFS